MARGTLVGELSLITETRRPVTVRAAEPSSVMRIPRALFLKTLQGFPEMAERLRQTMLRRTEQLASDLGAVRTALDIGPEAPAAAPAEPAPEQSA
jgi:CRP-like cAMP-binding protein